MAAAWTVVDDLDDSERRDVAALLDAIYRRTGDEPLTEAQQARLDEGAPLRHALRRDRTGELTGYAVLADGDVTAAEPALGTFDDDLARYLEGEAEPTALLLRNVDEDLEASLVARGWRPSRTLHRLVRELPAVTPPPRDVEMRAFRPGVDDDAWIAQNNASFAGHPSQGDMTPDRLHARFSAAWFDPAGFLLFFDGSKLVASCWTKLHHAPDGDVGEIYVVSVAPGAQGRGLGRLAVLEGLSHLSALGARTAELYVEATNEPANALYEQLGFTCAARVVEFRRGEADAS